MPHRRRERVGVLRLSRIMMLVAVLLLLVACGPFSEDEAEPTATTIEQPTGTVEETSEVETPVETATMETTPEPTESTVTEDATGTPVEISTPAVSETEAPVRDEQPVVEATPSTVETDESASPVATEEPTEVPQDDSVASGPQPTAAIFTGSDGTSGATPISVPRTGVSVSTPVAGEGTPEGTPGLAVLEETRTSGTVDLRAIDPISVDSCNPDNVPSLIDGEATYVTNSSVNFRNGPGADCDTIGNGPLGSGIPVQVTSVPVDREGDDFIWVQIRVNDIVGWVVLEALDPA